MKIRTSRRSRNVILEMKPGESALPPAAVPELKIKRILVPVDFSDWSHKAFHYAIHFGRQFNAEIILLHVIVSVPPPPEMVILEREQLSAKYFENSAKELARWRKEVVPKVAVKAVTRSGTAAHHEIVEAARESNCDLIIIGNRGRTGLARMLLGGTAEPVVRHAPCPV